MGDIADWYVEQMMMDEYYEREREEDMLIDYIDSHTEKEIVEDARHWLQHHTWEGKDRDMVLGILAYYRGYQKLSIKQKRSLAYRILFV